MISGGSFEGGGVDGDACKVSIKLRIPRWQQVGDKFATRHGQKGVMATLWPHEDMPFNPRTGMVPDILFNPHGFPSRMTIGQLIESMAGKAAALTGRVQANATAFRKYRGHFCGEDENEDDIFLERDPMTAVAPVRGGLGGNAAQCALADQESSSASSSSGSDDVLQGIGKKSQTTAANYFGEALRDAGYAYYGTEELYDGIHGEPMQTHIFMGLIYYQRLRHMVADKMQVRATGPLDPTTRQPVKGRQRHGGIRLGEMERDALLAHGTAFLVHDRLMRCSDYSLGYVKFYFELKFETVDDMC